MADIAGQPGQKWGSPNNSTHERIELDDFTLCDHGCRRHAVLRVYVHAGFFDLCQPCFMANREKLMAEAVDIYFDHPLAEAIREGRHVGV